mmetsp:Transcript_14848/g.20351  ORF Transcript_14848/g.20351 Transcript_14848/m.20351 type:complete len:273 (-) Transcript_14848:97-915(-)
MSSIYSNRYHNYLENFDYVFSKISCTFEYSDAEMSRTFLWELARTETIDPSTTATLIKNHYRNCVRFFIEKTQCGEKEAEIERTRIQNISWTAVVIFKQRICPSVGDHVYCYGINDLREEDLFKSLDETEVGRLIEFRKIVHIACTVIPKSQKKGILLAIGSRLEGDSYVPYTTGGKMSTKTRRRIRIIEVETRKHISSSPEPIAVQEAPMIESRIENRLLTPPAHHFPVQMEVPQRTTPSMMVDNAVATSSSDADAVFFWEYFAIGNLYTL